MKTLCHVLAALFLLSALPAEAAVVSVPVAQLGAAWKPAACGDALDLTGDAGPTTLAAKACPGNPVVIRYNGFQQQGRLTVSPGVDGLDIVGVTAVVVPAAAPDYGVHIDQARNVRVLGGSFTGVSHGVVVNRASNFTIDGIKCSLITVDCVDIASSQNGRVVNSYCNGNVPANPLIHPDCFQVWSRPSYAPSADILIANNTGGGKAQFVFLGDHKRLWPVGTVVWDAVTGTRTLTVPETLSDGGFDRMIVRDNTAQAGLPNGVSIGNCRGCVEENNHITTYPGVTFQSRVSYEGLTLTAASPIAHCGNSFAAYTVPSGGFKPGWTDVACVPPPPPKTPLELAQDDVLRLTAELAAEKAAHGVDVGALGQATAALSAAQAALLASQGAVTTLTGERDAARAVAASERAVLDQIEAAAQQIAGLAK